MTPHILKTTALAAALALLAGCPAAEENNTNNAPTPDATIGDDAGTDASEDASEDVGADVGDDAGRAEITCVESWSSVETLPRGEAGGPVKLLTLCKGATIEELSALSGSAQLEGDQELAAQSVAAEAFQGEWLRVSATFDMPEGSFTSAKVPFVSLKLGEVEVGVDGPRTHKGDEEVKKDNENKATLTTTEASSLTADNPVFQAGPGASNNILHSKPAGGGTGVITLNVDQRTMMLKMYETPLGGGGGEVRGEFAFGRVDRASMVRANNPDGSAQIYVIAECLNTQVSRCTQPLGFGRATLDAGGEVTQVETLGGLDDIVGLPPAEFDGETLAYTELLVANGGGAKLRLVYAAEDVVKKEVVWAAVDAFDLSSSRTPRLRLEGTTPDIGGVTPQMVADGEASIGIIRAPSAATLDPTRPVLEDNLIPWSAIEGPNGGTTFSMPFEDGFKDVTFQDVVPGTAEMHTVYGGTKEERAVVLTGTNRRRVPLDYIGAYNFSVEISGYRRLSTPNAPLPVGATRQDVIVGGEDSDAGTSNFAVVLGLNNTKKTPEAPAIALLVEEEMNAVLYRGGGELSGDTPYPYEARAPLYLQEDPNEKGGTAVQLPGGIAVLAPIDVLECDTPGACDDVVARTATNFAVLLGGEASECDEEECRGPGIFFYPSSTRSSMRLFDDSPGYAFLISRRARAFDTPDGTSAHAVAIPFGYEDGSGGLHLATIGADGTVTSSAPMSLEGDDASLITQDTELLSFDGADGVFVTPVDGVWTVGHMKSRDNGGTTSITLIATVEISYESASGQLTVPSACPMHHPSCVLASARFAKAPSKTYRIDTLNGDEAQESVLDGAFEAGAEPAPGVLMISEWDTGTACGLATLLYTDIGDATAEPIVVSTSDERDCSDLAVPVAVGDILGQGGEEFVLLRKTAEGGTLSVLFVGEGVEGDQAIYDMELGEVGAAVNVAREGAARRVQIADVDDDGLPDVSFQQNVNLRGGDIVFQDTSKLTLFHTHGGGALRVDGKLQIPGLDVFGAGGVRGQVGGVQFSNGKGTRLAATSISSRPELL